MTKVAIVPTPTSTGEIAYHAVSSNGWSLGKTPGQALDALTDRLSPEDDSTVVIIQPLRPDRFFGAEEQQRLADLMARWRTARDAGDVLPDAVQRELEQLIAEEISASAARSATLLQELAQ